MKLTNLNYLNERNARDDKLCVNEKTMTFADNKVNPASILMHLITILANITALQLFLNI